MSDCRRAYHRIVKLLCMVADLAGSEEIQSQYLVVSLRAWLQNHKATSLPTLFPTH